MTATPFQAGDFVWCAFPERENPARPGPMHLAYTLAISGVGRTGPSSAISAYTTSQPWPGPVTPLGVRSFDREEAALLGQSRPFTLDLRRLAFVPITPAWFPQIDQLGYGVQGHAPPALRRQLEQIATELMTRRGEIVERLGTLWPPGKR